MGGLVTHGYRATTTKGGSPVIDRNRVRELARASEERRSDYKLELFLSEAEELAGYLLQIIREIQASPSGRSDPFEMLLAWCAADDKLHFKGRNVAEVQRYVRETYRQLQRHRRIVAMRKEVRGRVSHWRAEAAERLAYLAGVFDWFKVNRFFV
jgi:hypothetical protein